MSNDTMHDPEKHAPEMPAAETASLHLRIRMQLGEQWQIWLIALGFFTRIPVPKNLPFTTTLLNRASRYFSLVGLLIGGISAGVFWLASQLWSPETAIFMAMVASLLITGAFHEDGLADVFDGFGGGWSVAQKLEIMKDSRLGSYGACALVMVLLGKFTSLSDLTNPALGLLLGHSLSRAVASSLIFDQPYVRDQEYDRQNSSKVKPLASQQTRTDLLILLGVASLPLLLLPLTLALALAGTLIICRVLLVIWFRRQIGGYTGDCLGAAQQLSELAIYLTLLAWQTVAVSALQGAAL